MTSFAYVALPEVYTALRSDASGFQPSEHGSVRFPRPLCPRKVHSRIEEIEFGKVDHEKIASIRHSHACQFVLMFNYGSPDRHDDWKTNKDKQKNDQDTG